MEDNVGKKSKNNNEILPGFYMNMGHNQRDENEVANEILLTKMTRKVNKKRKKKLRKLGKNYLMVCDKIKEGVEHVLENEHKHSQ